MMRKDGVGLSNEAWARRLAYLKQPGMSARNLPHNQLLQDQDVPDLTESLTKTLVHGHDRKSDTHGNETLDSLEEIDEDDLALFLPDVASSSDSETGTFPHNYVDIIGDQFDHMESLDAITNIASSCTTVVATCASGSGAGNEEIARAFQQHVGTRQKQAMLPDTTNHDLLPLESLVHKTGVSETITRPDQQSDQVQGANVNHPTNMPQLEELSSLPSQSCETQSSGSVMSPDNNNHCMSTASGSPCCDTLAYSQADSHCYLDTGPGSSCHQQHNDHDLHNLDSVSNVSPDSGILSISESPESHEAASPCNPITTHHPTLSPQSVFLDSVSPPRHADYLQPEADSTDDHPGYHSDINDEPPPLIPMFDHNVLIAPVQRRGRGRPRKNLLIPENAIISPTKLDHSFDSTISEDPPDLSRERIIDHGVQFKEIRIQTPPSKPKKVTKPSSDSGPKKRGPGRPKGSGEKSRTKIKDLLLLSAIEREQALGNKGVNVVCDLNQFTKAKGQGRKRKSETVKALFAMAEEAKKSQKLTVKKVVSLEKGYGMTEDNCDEDNQVKKKVRKPVSSKVLASGLKATDTRKGIPGPKPQKPTLPKAPRKSISMIMDELKSGASLPVLDRVDMIKSTENVSPIVIPSSEDELSNVTYVKQKYNANVIAESYRVVSGKSFISETHRLIEPVSCKRKVKDLISDLKPSENVTEKLAHSNVTVDSSNLNVTDKLLSAKQKDTKVPKNKNKNISWTKSSTPKSSPNVDSPVKKKRGPGRPRKSPLQPPGRVNKVATPRENKAASSSVDKAVLPKMDKVLSDTDMAVLPKVRKVVSSHVGRVPSPKKVLSPKLSPKESKPVSPKEPKAVSPQVTKVVSPKVSKVTSPKVTKLVSPKARSEGPLSDSSRRSGEDFASLIQSVQASIDSQFKGYIDDSEDNQDDSPGNSLDEIEPSSLSSPPKTKQHQPPSKQSKQLAPGAKTKPKVKKPKVHVMMRRTKRRRRKKKVEKPDVSESLSVETDLCSAGTVEYETSQDNAVGLLMVVPSTSSSSVEATSPSSPCPVVPSAGLGDKEEKEEAVKPTAEVTVVKAAGKATFGAGSQLREKTEELSKTLLPSSSSTAQPAPKLQLLPPCEKPHSKVVKKKKLKPFKSKHKNIIDPVFLEDVDEMSEQLEKLVLDLRHDMSVARNVKPGEDPMPDIFRKQTYIGRKRKKEWLSIHKQQNKELRKLREEFRKVKDRDKKVEKAKEKCAEPEEPVAPPFGATLALAVVDKQGKGKGKKIDGRKRKRSVSESEVVVQKPVALSPILEHNDHCLPLKKRHKLFTAASEGQKKTDESPVKSSPTLAPLVLPPAPTSMLVAAPVKPPKRKVGRPRKNVQVEDKPRSDSCVTAVADKMGVVKVVTAEKKTPGRRPKNVEKQFTGEKASPVQSVAKPVLSEAIRSVPMTYLLPKPKPSRSCRKKDVPVDSEQKDGTNQATNTDNDKTENSSSGNDKTSASDQSGPIKKRSPGRPRKNVDAGKKGSGDDDKSPERPKKIEKNTAPCISPERPDKDDQKKLDPPVSESTQVSVADEGVQADSTVSEGTQSEVPVCESKRLCTSATQTCDDDFKVLIPTKYQVEKDVQTCTSASQTQTPPIDDLENSPIGPKFQKEFEQFISQRSSVDSSKTSAESVNEEKLDKPDIDQGCAETLVTSKVSGVNGASADRVESSTADLKTSSCSPLSLSHEKPIETDSDVEVISSTSAHKKSSLKRSGAGRRCDPNNVDPILEKYLKKPDVPEVPADNSGCQDCSKLQDIPPRKKNKHNPVDTKLKSNAVVSLNKVKFSGLSKAKAGRKHKGKPGRKRKKQEPPMPSPPAKRGRGRKPKRRPGRPPKVKPAEPVHKKVSECADSSEYSSESDYVEEQRVDSKSLTREYHPLPVPPRKRKRVKDVGEKVAKKKRRKEGEPGEGKEPRKKYQKAGLFSDLYKESSSVKKSKAEEASKEAANHKPKTLYNPEDHEHGLLPLPIHVGKYMTEKEVDFQLPYDIWWLHSRGQLQKNIRPTPHYKKIRNNVYIDMKPVCPYESNPCNCIAPTVYNNLTVGCADEDCLNRMVYTECSPSTCASKEKCSNMRLQKHEWAPGLHLFYTGDRGYGVKCKYAITAGNFIIEYVGEVVSEQEFKTRMTQMYNNEPHHYCLNLDGGTVIDGYRMGSLCRFVNHSCEPNCEMQKWNVNGVYRVGLFALRDIKPNEELSYDYNFDNYNLEQQQECKCGSANCRGTIGGRAQRMNSIARDKNPVGRPPNDKRKSKSKLKKRKESEQATERSQYLQPMRPMSHRERCFILRHNIGLLRNLEKVRRIRQRMMKSTDDKKVEVEQPKEKSINHKDVFMSQFMALKTPRHIKTRRLKLGEEDSGVTRTAKLAQVLTDIFSAVADCKDEDGNNIAAHLMTLPPKKSHPAYYQVIKKLITLTSIEDKILSGEFSTPDPFDEEMLTLFKNVEVYCGKKSEMGLKVKHLRKVFYQARSEANPRIDEIMGTGSLYSANSEVEPSEADSESRHPEDDEDEEIIRCICGIYKDEGLMIQCEKCMVWQHCDCMRVSGDEENYLCEDCDPRPVDKEVPFTECDSSTPPEQTQYMTLFRDELLVRLGNCVYITRQTSVGEEPPVRPSYQSVEDPNRDHLDIFRVERLWVDEKNEKFAYGHVYLRPQETFHEPSRKFFPNEVFRVPMYDVIPLNAIFGACHVLDLNTYCKGRPKGVIKEEDVYICEYRLDKTAHVFYKISRSKYPTNIKSYCFDSFEKKLQPKRTFSPHTVPDSYKRKGSYSDTMSTTSGDIFPFQMAAADGDNDTAFIDDAGQKKPKKRKDPDTDSDEDLPLARVRDKKRQERKDRLNIILTKLLANVPGKQPVDLTYLLEGGRGKRARKKSHPLSP
ncbi:uncharacterized protein LOC135483383 isoform X2 [Lineus longissimus]